MGRIKIKRTNSDFEREPLLAPFGFKGGYMRESWQTVVLMESENGYTGVGLGTQNVLWSDATVFANHSEAAGNSLMYLLTAYSLKIVKEIPFETPVELLEELLPATYEYGCKIIGNEKLRLTFALNALVAVDNAAWQVYTKENGRERFEEMIPEEARPALSFRHEKLACIPLMSYGVPISDIVKTLEEGFFFLKIKIGSDPDKDGDYEKMLRWDKERLTAIHRIAQDRQIPYTDKGWIPYYLDANGRYDSKERLLRLLDHAAKIGALERIMIVEEPFPEEYRVDVSDIPVRLAADESAHSDKDALERIQMGYKAIALKPIAKTMSMSLKIATLAHQHHIPCFCADLTVNPILVDWNKNVACRLAPLPGMKIGVLESNGHQNYRHWERMKSYHPRYGAAWIEPIRGIFNLGEEFYACSGGIFEPSPHYLELVK